MKRELHVEEVIDGHGRTEVSASCDENEDDERGTSECEVLEEVDHLALLGLCILDGPEVMHHESGRYQEDGEEKGAEICVDAERYEEATKQDHESG